jgi:hypothetical protein
MNPPRDYFRLEKKQGRRATAAFQDGAWRDPNHDEEATRVARCRVDRKKEVARESTRLYWTGEDLLRGQSRPKRDLVSL